MITFTAMTIAADEFAFAEVTLEEHSEGSPSYEPAFRMHEQCRDNFYDMLAEYRNQHGCQSEFTEMSTSDILTLANKVVSIGRAGQAEEGYEIEDELHDAFTSETISYAEQAEAEAYQMHKEVLKAEVHAKAVIVWKEAQMAWCVHLYNEGHRNLSLFSHSIVGEDKESLLLQACRDDFPSKEELEEELRVERGPDHVLDFLQSTMGG
jgi:hypothetical protein